MIHNFESWRKAKQQRFEPMAFEMHYHRVADSCYHLVSHLLRSMVVSFVDGARQPISVQLSAEQAQCLVDFLEQMEFAYIHPRSTSARWKMRSELSLKITSSIC